MFAKLTAAFGGGYNFPYNVEEAYPNAWGQWTHHRGTGKDDGAVVSVFKMSSADPTDRRLAVARNGVKRLKMLRHPNILAYKDGAEVQEKGQTVLYLVTQPVKPLKLVLETLNLQGKYRDEYLAMGILHMTNAVSFLNNDCKLIHGNICMDAVVVTETLDWKLHGFDLLSEHSLPPDQCLMHASWMVGNQYKPAELGKAEWDTISQAPPWAVDAWGLGCLIQEVFSQQYMSSLDNLRRTDSIPPALLGDYQKLLSSAPTRRLNPAKVAECKFLNNRLVEVVAFMENISVKDSMDKESFFKKLGAALPSIPPAVAVQKILPLLAHALEFGGAPPHAVAPLLLIGNTLESEEFNRRVVPTLSKLFASPDRSLRRSLLESIDSYASHLTTPVLEEQIYVHMQSGFTDGNAYIRELTLKSMLSLAPKLTNKTLVNNVLKHLSKLQVDEEASIRANTTVLLGNIAKYLGESTCKRVLLNAFTRALKDVFPPAKIAGLRAMVATSQYHGPEDAALRILPAVAPLAIEPMAEVRTHNCLKAPEPQC
ncbi:armadillo-type protein [Haematococcus lacustris]